MHRFSITFLIIVTRVHYCHYHLLFSVAPPPPNTHTHTHCLGRGGCGAGWRRRAAEVRAFCEARALQVINLARGGRWEETENMWAYQRLCVFLLRRLIGELTCRYPLKGISLASLLPYKQRNKALVTPVSTPAQRALQDACSRGVKKSGGAGGEARRGYPRS